VGEADVTLTEVGTRRLRLIPIDANSLAGLIDSDVTTAEQRYSVRFPRPYLPPPLMADALPPLLERLTSGPEGGWWSVWLFSRVDIGDIVGGGGFAGPPDDQGAVQIGYSVYEPHQGQGFATEAVRALVDWAFEQPAVNAVRATIPPWNAPSVRVATKLGMQQVGVGRDDEVGEIHVYEIVEPRSASGEDAGDAMVS
jgi:RimJ/RimL family protein N-acetyltransferase